MSADETRAVILDRDGTINADRPDYVTQLSELVILPGVPAAIARLSRGGFRVLVCTVQACVGKGIITRARLDEINGAITSAVAQAGGVIDGWYVCPHVDADRCDCRKPLPGLVRQAQRAWGFAPTRTWVVGDAERDLGMAASAGCPAALVLTGKGATTRATHPQIPAFADLAEFSDRLLAGDARLRA